MQPPQKTHKNIEELKTKVLWAHIVLIQHLRVSLIKYWQLLAADARCALLGCSFPLFHFKKAQAIADPILSLTVTHLAVVLLAKKLAYG
jgi:hypothetical protein